MPKKESVGHAEREKVKYENYRQKVQIRLYI